MSSSVTPTKDSDLRFDQGATWFCDYCWKQDDEAQTPIDISSYDVEVCFFHPSGSLAMGPYSVGNGVTKTGNTGEFEIRVSSADTEFISEKINLTMRVDLTRTGTDDLVTDYKVGEVVALVTGTITGYPKHAGE